MDFKNKKIWISILLVVGVFLIYRYINRDGNSYAECLNNKRSEIQNEYQARIAVKYCTSIFPHNPNY